MGLFSLFKRIGTPRRKDDPAEADAARLIANSEAQRQSARQREIARATALKIDAIEAAMVFDIFNTPEPAWGSGPKRAARPPKQESDEPGSPAPTLLDAQTTGLPDDDALPDPAVAAQAAPVMDEIAILYANDQVAAAEQMLVASLPEPGDCRTGWWMLFDLYQVTGQHEQFDNLSIDYATRFETSAPAWAGMALPDGTAKTYSGVTPTQAFSGTLDRGIAPQIERLQQLAGSNPVLRLEFDRVTAVEPAGCALLLHGLKALQARQCELIVVAAAELADRIRGMIRVGQRGDTEACWLLLLELLQLLNREKEFEETSMDYCVTFEISPPSFMHSSKVATAAKQHTSASLDRFMLPATVGEGSSTALFDAIGAYAEQCDAIVFDCSRLIRIDFGAAGMLLSRLQVLASNGKKIEFRDVNHLVAALLRLLAFSDIAKIFPHKY